MNEPSFPPVDAAQWRAQVERELRGADWDEALVSTLPGDLAIEALYSARPTGIGDGPCAMGNTQLCMPFSADRLEEDLANGVRNFWVEKDEGAEPELPDDATLHGSAGERDIVDAFAAQEAGASIPLELAIALAAGVEFLRAGSSPDRIQFRMGLGRDIFAELSKLRSLQTLWSGILAASSIEPSAASIHAVSSRLILSDADRWVNILRVGGTAFSAILGGADLFTPRPYEPASASAARIARNTTHILLQESHLGWFEDPARGSYYLESLGEQIATRAWGIFQQIEARGGHEKARKDGSLQEQIDASWDEQLARVGRGEDPLVGVTDFVNSAEELPPARPDFGRRLAQKIEEQMRNDANGGFQ